MSQTYLIDRQRRFSGENTRCSFRERPFALAELAVNPNRQSASLHCPSPSGRLACCHLEACLAKCVLALIAIIVAYPLTALYRGTIVLFGRLPSRMGGTRHRSAIAQGI